MRNILLTACLSSFVFIAPVNAQETIIAGVSLGLSETAAAPLIDSACAQVMRIEVFETRFPAASNSEVHLRCGGLTLSDGSAAGDAMFTFADNALVMIEVRGSNGQLRPEGDPAFQAPGFDVFMPVLAIAHTGIDRIDFISGFPLAPLAISWDNPAWTTNHPSAPDEPFFLPSEIVFGASVAEMTDTLDGVCPLSMGRQIEEVWLATEPTAQFQIDCIGYEIAGYPRKLEFVFGDDTLQQIWLMFDVGDIARIREFLTAQYGEPLFVDEQYEIFDDYRLALRKDIPEIRYVSDEIAAILASQD